MDDQAVDDRQPADVDLASALSLLGAAVDGAVLHALAAAGLHGLRPGHGYVIQRLVDGPSTASEIASSLEISQQAVSKTMGELRTLGYVRFTTDASDRRRRPVALTASGRRAVRVARGERAAFARRLEKRVGQDRLESARAVLGEAMQLLELAGRVRNRSVPPPPQRS